MDEDEGLLSMAPEEGAGESRESRSLFSCLGRMFNRRPDVAAQLCSPERITRLHALKSLMQANRRVVASTENQLLGALRGKDAEEREAAEEVIRSHYQPERLRRRLGHPDPEEQMKAAWLLLAFEQELAVPQLLDKAQTAEHEAIRQTCVEVLVHLGSETVITAAVEELSRDDPRARRCGTQVLTSIGSRAHGLLVRALADPRRQVRLGAVRALEATGDTQVTEALYNLLSDPVEEVRAEAARVLSDRDSEAATDRLVAALADPSVLVRLQSAATLTRIPGERAVEALGGFLRTLAADPDFEVADREFMHAVAGCRQLPPALFLELLGGVNEQLAINLALALEEAGTAARWLEEVQGADPQERAARLELLQALGQLGVREPFLEGLGWAGAELRAVAAWLLGECKHAPAVGPLVGLLCDSEVVVRRKAVQALAKIADPVCIPALLETLGDPDQEVRASAVEALAAMLAGSQEQPPVEAQEGALVPVDDQPAGPRALGTGTALPAIRLSPYSLPARFSEALGRLAMATMHSHVGADSVLTSTAALIRCLHDPSAWVRQKAAEAVADLSLGNAASSLLERALHDAEAGVRTAAAKGLSRLPGTDYSGALVRALGHADPAVRCRAAEALGESGATHAAPELIAALGDANVEVRQKAARALWQVATGGMAEQLLEHLHSPDPKVRCAIVGVLGRIRAVGALEALANRLEDPNKQVRASALNSLARLGQEARPCLERVVAAIGDPDSFVRSRAVEALGMIGSGEYGQIMALLDASRDREPKVAEAAMRWLVQLANQGNLRPLVDALTSPEYENSVRTVLERADLTIMRSLLRIAREVNEATSKLLLGVISEVLRKRGSLDDCRMDLLSLDPTVRLAGLESLGLLRRPEATQLIVEVLANDPLPALRERAASILSELGDPVGLAALARARAQASVGAGEEE